MLKKYQKNVNYFASTRDISSVYKFLASASQKNIEKKLNIKTEILIIKKRFPSIKFLFFFMYSIFSGKLFSNERYILLEYRGHNLGRFAYATTSVNIESFYKVLKSLILKLKYLLVFHDLFFWAYGYSKLCLRSMNSSMNPVVTSPDWNLGSLIIAFWRGIVVLTPLMMYSLKARYMRAIATSRVRP